MSWTTPQQLTEQVQKRWERGEILRARLTGQILFPLRLRLNKPSASDITERFDEVRRWAQALLHSSNEQRGFGYAIESREVRHRVHGRNSVPDAVLVPAEEDALKLIGKTSEAINFGRLTELTLALFPRLREWLARKPLTVLEHAADWQRILAVLAYFCTNPRPNLYSRQLHIPEVDTKFIEGRKALFTELLDAVLAPEMIDTEAVGARSFERRYGLRTEAPLIRFRILDPALFIKGLSDLSVPPDQFARLVLPVRHVFITENKVNGLAFPDVPNAIVIFGLGYGLERLADIGWISNAVIWYWGDIDSHGFAILDRLRGIFPQVHSLLMDRETLMAHVSLWGREEVSESFVGVLRRLTEAELALFDDLKHNRLGERVRLEQERIGYQWLQHAVLRLCDESVMKEISNEASR